MTIIHEKNSKHQTTTTTTRSNQLAPPHRAIEVLSIEPGTAPGVLAVCAVKVGSVLIRSVKISSRGRGTYINFPARMIDGEWVELIEISSPSLRSAVVATILAAVSAMGGER